MIGRLNHVAIAVPGLEAASAQYRDILGAKVNPSQDEPVLFLHPKDFSGTLVELEQV